MKLVNDAVKPGLAYKDHRIVITRVGNGWRAMIYAPGHHLPYVKARPTLSNRG